MNKRLYNLMNWPDIEGIIYLDYRHPKALLGSHAVKGGTLIQTFFKNAIKATVKFADGKLVPMEMADEQGYFAVLMPEKKISLYSFVYEFEDGNTYEVYDAYSFEGMIPENFNDRFVSEYCPDAGKYLGAHPARQNGVEGVNFAIYAPDALRASVVGTFNNWDGHIHQMEYCDKTGIFELFVPNVGLGEEYKFELRKRGGFIVIKSDDYNIHRLPSNDGASIICDDNSFEWTDDLWMKKREKCKKNENNAMSVYEIYPSAFPKDDSNSMVQKLISHMKRMNYNYIEIMTDTNFIVNYTADEIKNVVNEFHKAEIGIIFNYSLQSDIDTIEMGSHVLSTLVDKVNLFHLDGVKIDNVSDFLNNNGVAFIQNLTDYFDKELKNVLIIAEDNSDWPYVTGKNKELNGLGFDYKFDSGWNNNFLYFLGCDPLFRRGRFESLLHSLEYAYSEHFILPFTHNDVTRKSLFKRMPGRSDSERFSNLRAAYAFMYTHPGKKHTFLGQDMGVKEAFDFSEGYSMDIAETEENRQFENYMAALNFLYCNTPELCQTDYIKNGFEWINNTSKDECIISFIRRLNRNRFVLVVINFTPVLKVKYKIGVPSEGRYKEIFNSDNEEYGGKGNLNKRAVNSKVEKCDGKKNSIQITVPPMGMSVLRFEPAIKSTIKKEKNNE